MPTATLAPCLFYFVHLTAEGYPIPSTMFSKTTNNFDKNLKCFEARLPATQMSTVGRCYPGFHWYYKVSKSSGQILANSLFQTQNRLTNLCSGPYQILEYIVYGTDTNN